MELIEMWLFTTCVLNGSFYPHELHKAIQDEYKLVPGEQQDIHEIFTRLCSSGTQNMNDIIAIHFQSGCQFTKTCRVCAKHDDLTPETRTTIIVPVLNGIHNLERSIVHAMNDDHVPIYCSSCEKSTANKLSGNFVFLPQTLDIGFNRFQQKGGITKNHSRVQLPLELQVTNVEQQGLKMENIIGESFDGASNMCREFGGVRAEADQRRFAKFVVHMVLRSCAKPCCSRYDSCKRMDVWSRIKIDEAVGSAKLRKLQKIGDTIWCPKQAVLETIFGPYNNKKRNIFCHAKVFYVKHPITCKQVVWITLVLGTWCSHQKTKYTESHMTPLYEASSNFTQSMNAKLAEDDLDNIKVESKLEDSRVMESKHLISYLDPRRFDEIVLSGVSENSLTKVAKITGVRPLSLKEELCCLARNFTLLSRSLPDESEGASDDVATMTSTNEEETSEEESSGNEDGGVSKNPILRN
ncbi:zinc finger MYM-type 1-like [Paramuricea clavata]|uniref:Zinc finger MYM-type 1-like n=1 Tax=Paramuricea clavata TaxID=317549 RepID=A0A7D9EX60_PARCT|nr:zinc finger MYM-type 1-like [Paramuricea clavata]